ncbi:MAG: serine/threonine-protein kinase HipA [Thermoproteota archaeon]|jgi:serine/threonine-protein kinase HipA
MQSSSASLKLWINLDEVGLLSLNLMSNELMFSYTESWKEKGFGLSPHLKLDAEAKTLNQNILMFIENLLPEEENRELLAKQTGVSRTAVFALIKKIGLETTGAIRFANELPKKEAVFREIKEEELASKLDDDSTQSLITWDKKARLSIAGVQRKLPVIIKDGKMGLGDGTLCSTHILKFQKKELSKKSIVINEFLCMKLASVVKLNVADVEFKKTREHPYILVKRFDRKLKGEEVLREHVVDGCQAMNLPLSHKYERPYGDDGEIAQYNVGASFEKLFAVLKTCRVPIKAKQDVIRWIIFNLIIGNSDSHAKNISFFVGAKGIEVTPFYDLLCVAIYKDTFDTNLAFSICDEIKLENIGAYQLASFCDEFEISKRLFLNEFSKMAQLIKANINQFDECLTELSQVEESFYQELKSNIMDRLTSFEEQFSMLMDVKLIED